MIDIPRNHSEFVRQHFHINWEGIDCDCLELKEVKNTDNLLLLYEKDFLATWILTFYYNFGEWILFQPRNLPKIKPHKNGDGCRSYRPTQTYAITEHKTTDFETLKPILEKKKIPKRYFKWLTNST